MTDVIFDLGGTLFNYRVAAVAIEDGRVLLSNEGRDNFWTLPGGRVKVGEPTAESLRRELLEELGTDARVGTLLWVVENFFSFRDETFHELLFCWSVQLPELTGLTGVDNPRVQYAWHPVNALSTLNLHPRFLHEALTRPPSTPAHIVQHDG